MTRKIVLACNDPVGTYWQLGELPPAQGKVMLIGWRLPVTPADSGVAARCQHDSFTRSDIDRHRHLPRLKC